MSEFDNINGIYAKDATLREGIATLRNTVVSQTIKPLTVTQNGTYTADQAEGTYGYSPITVDVVEQPWQPLEDGYSNFWFELTDDTLSPWLNFSAKNNDAVIDWGDGSGEVALDTLTPTHTYAKAGKYVVKVKGVTGIDRQHLPPNTKYTNVLSYIEFNNEVTAMASYAFINCNWLKEIYYSGGVTFSTGVFRFCGALIKVSGISGVENVSNELFSYCLAIDDVYIDNTATSIGTSGFSYCRGLTKITIPSSVTSIGNSAFAYCGSLSEVHCEATTPPILGTTVFVSLPSNYIIYVPVGYGETYKSAAGWSAYADHILEEGQTPNRAMLSRLAKAAETDTDNEEMR